ncbi:CDA2_2 [Sanghuangporus weigelae]
MKPVIALATLFTLASATDWNARREFHARFAKRQATTTTSSATSSVSVSASTPVSSGVSSASLPATSGVSGISVSGTTTAVASVATTLAGTSIPPLSEITSGAVSESTIPLSSTAAVGQVPSISGAPPLPSYTIIPSDWPAMDRMPPTDSAEVQEWMQELQGFDIPDLSTTDGTCAGSPEAAADAANRGWWTCGGYTRGTDIVACPDKLTWGMSFDDGPGFYTTKLLDFLNERDLKSTFFVVGSRVIQNPEILRAEYLAGHEISLHTWSHPDLTKLTNEQIVAEFGWTRKAIQTVLGVTPVTMRPPYGDIDDRVRAIALAMGMVPIIWTRGTNNEQFDTNDWRVPGGTVTGPQSLEAFENILGNATQIDTGFIVLQHDLYQQSVDLAVGYTLDRALNFTPTLTLEPIGVCQGWPATDLYLETTTNTTFPYPDSVISTNVTTTASARATAVTAGGAAQGSGARANLASLPTLGAMLAGLSVLVGGLLMV